MFHHNIALPSIAIVGRPNVGKSTLFNRLTHTRDALVANFPGLTRDRVYGFAQIHKEPMIVIDTGGIGEEKEEGIFALAAKQTRQAIEESDIILFLVDGRAGRTGADEAIAQELRPFAHKPILLIVNKVDGLNTTDALSDFYAFGFSECFPISAAHGEGLRPLEKRMTQLLAQRPVASEEETVADNLAPNDDQRIKIAMLGRPNAGKSTLVNRILGEDRVIVYDQPGTTRDSVFIPFDDQEGRQFTLIDTAGVRRRSRVHETIEKFSVVKALQAIEACDVVVIVLDAHEGLSEQDLHLIGVAYEAGKGMVLAINKWDGLTPYERTRFKEELDRRFQFLTYVERFFISAMHGSNVGYLLPAVCEVYESARKKLTTPKLTQVLQEAIATHNPPIVKGRRIKLRYAHSGGRCPQVIVIHGTQTEQLPDSYTRYLENTFRAAFKLVGVPIRIELKTSTNPFAHLKKRQR